MKLYVTDNGTWGGTQAEMPAKARDDGSPLGGWKAVEVPTKKSTLIDFLNHHNVLGTPATAAPRVRERPAPVETGAELWRVYSSYGGVHQFLNRVRDDTADGACRKVAETLHARPAPTG